MKELVEKVAALYADFAKMLTLRLKTVTKQQELALVKLLWKSKKAMKEFRKASLEASKK